MIVNAYISDLFTYWASQIPEHLDVTDFKYSSDLNDRGKIRSEVVKKAFTATEKFATLVWNRQAAQVGAMGRSVQQVKLNTGEAGDVEAILRDARHAKVPLSLHYVTNSMEHLEEFEAFLLCEWLGRNATRTVILDFSATDGPDDVSVTYTVEMQEPPGTLRMVDAQAGSLFVLEFTASISGMVISPLQVEYPKILTVNLEIIPYIGTADDAVATRLAE